LCWFPTPPKSHEGNAKDLHGCLHNQRIAIWERKTELGGFTAFTESRNKLALSWGEILTHPLRLPTANITLRSSPDKEHSSILGILGRNLQGAQPLMDCLS